MSSLNINTSVVELEASTTGDYDETLGSLIFFTVVYGLVFLSGLFGNLLVLYVIFKDNHLKNFTNYFFANLSAADVFVLIFCIPTAIHDIWAKDQWYLGKFLCISNQYIENCATSISSLTIAAISFERFVAICSPFKVQDIFNETSTLIMTITIWAIAFDPTDSTSNSSDLITVCQVNAESSGARAYITWFIITLIFIPLFVLFVAYTRIIFQLAKTRRTPLLERHDDRSRHIGVRPSTFAEQEKPNSFLAYRRIEQKRLNTVIICVITVAFFACQCPARIIQLINMHQPVQNEAMMSHLVWIWTWKFSKLLFFLNFTANPIIYNLLSTKFRRSCQRFLHLRRWPDPSSGMSNFRSTLCLQHEKNVQKVSFRLPKETNVASETFESVPMKINMKSNRNNECHEVFV